MTSASDRLHELTLVPCARSRYPLRDDFTLFRDEAAEPFLVLIINVDFLALTEAARSPFLNLLFLFCHVIAILMILVIALLSAL